MNDFTLTTPVKELSGVGKRYTKRLEKMGLQTVRDLLFHAPRRYEDFTDVRTTDTVRVGEDVTLQGTVQTITNRHAKRNKRLTITEAIIADDTGSIRAVWFNRPYLIRSISTGTAVSLAGKVSVDYDGPVMSNPSYEKIPAHDPKHPNAPNSDRPLQLRHTGRLVPIYPETEGVTSRFLRFVIESILSVAENIEDPLPLEVRNRHNLPSLADALHALHHPADKADAERARRRLAFEELLILQLHVLQHKHKRAAEVAPAIPFAKNTTKQFVNRLPFTLTDAQRKAGWDIIQDLQQKRPMARLLEGDVGSGKTVVAVLAALQAIAAGCQTAVMTPTAILAHQHYHEIRSLLANSEVAMALLTADTVRANDTETDRTTTLQAIADGAVDIIVGTHALIQSDIAFNSLALVIVDEQHRFGVRQRASLVDRRSAQNKRGRSHSHSSTSRPHDSAYTPHLLSMTATPIPRTLALTLYGDLDLSILNEMPKGRKPVETRIIPPARRAEAYTFIRKQLDAGRQAFVVFPLIEESEALEAKNLEHEYTKLTENVFPTKRIGKLHGRMPASEKEDIMQQFAGGAIDILASTSVVEVGIDVPNATVMMVEGAERFGLAQLHQFRGRVGRGEHQSYCFLLTDSPAKTTRQRLQALQETSDGFRLAEHDLQIRGPGQFFGTQQSGLPDLAMASLRDTDLIDETREEASRLLEQDPTLEQWPTLRKATEETGARMHLE